MAKNIAFYLDGTGDKYFEAGPANSNVGRMYFATVEEDDVQLRYYEDGVGSHGDVIPGGGFGKGLDVRITHAYQYLIDNFDDGDTIFIFGFSRGAYEARSLAGMLGRVGLVRRGKSDGGTAYDMYRIAKSDPTVVKQFSDACCLFPRIKVVGVWDTVRALGIPIPFTNTTVFAPQFHDTDLGAHIDKAYHAVSIDEQRWDFQPTYWNPASVRDGQTLEQVNFPGVHSDIGGGYADDRRLADIALGWMIKRARDNGVIFDHSKITAASDDACFALMHDSFKPFYELRGRFYRVVDPGAPIHVAAKKRIEAQPNGCIPYPYRPVNLNVEDLDSYTWVE